MQSKAISISKFEKDATNEDAVGASDNCIAVADGAGGGGLYADRWSAYLIEQLPDTPLTSFDELNNWIDTIWEPFYDDCVEEAKKSGGMVLSKFYEEGSFATLVAIWQVSPQQSQWINYGDSVAFHYNPETRLLEHSFTTLKEFNRPPYLINCKDELRSEGFRTGLFQRTDSSTVFVASDALAHYIMMMYMVANKELFCEELEQAEKEQSKNSLLIRNARHKATIDFEEVLRKLVRAAHSTLTFKAHLGKLKREGLLADDDYSFCFQT